MPPTTSRSSGAPASIGDPAFLNFAISSRRSEILRALEATAYARAAYLETGVEGLPGISRVALFAWPEPPGRPLRIGVDVVRVDGRVLDRPITTALILEGPERPAVPHDDSAITVTAEELEVALAELRPAVITFGTVEWHLVAPGLSREVRELDRHGRPIFQEVDTAVYCYKLVCSKCGRARYARRNSIHEVQYCRVCTKQNRLRVRALSQYSHRKRRGTQRRLAPHEIDQIVEAVTVQQKTQREAAALVGVTESAVSKVLRRRRAP